MTAEQPGGRRVTQPDATRDLFAAFAKQITGGTPPFFATTVNGTVLAVLNELCYVGDPLTFDVLQAIHAERRRRLSAATREERRG